MSPDEPLFSRQELLGGLPARRASTVLFAIEARTAHLVVRSKRAMAIHETERSSANRERAFLDALAGARELPLEPTIQDLERFAPKWRDVAPTEPDLRAAIARLLARKYTLTQDRTPRLRAALGLDEPDTRAAYERLHGDSLETIYTLTESFSERVKWLRSTAARRLEELPPFWTAYALAVTETVGAGVLALPIALAGVGPLPGLVFLIVAGIFNILTIGGLVEAITRSGQMRYGSAFFGRLAQGLLGRGGSSVITVALFALNVVTFLTYLVAFAAPLASASHLSPAVWTIVLLLANLIFLKRDLNATVASALSIGVMNLALILLISVLALTHIDANNLSYAHLPFFGSHRAPLVTVALAFGVVMMAYFGHTSCGLVAKLILEREPSGKALMRGSIAATSTVVGLYCLAVFAINGAVGPRVLIGYSGTALEPLAKRVGPAITVIGAVYIVLAVGLASVYASLGMANQVQEWLPTHIERRTRFLLAAVPTIVVFGLVEWLVIVGRASVTDPLSIIGTLALPLLGGIFPMLLLAASRRRGDRIPASMIRVIRGPVSMLFIALGFVAGLVVQGFLIWNRPIEKIATAAVLAIIAAVVSTAARRGAFRPRAVIELRRETTGRGMYGVTVDGRSASATVRFEPPNGRRPGEIEDFESVRVASFELAPSTARELRVWVHGITQEGDSRGIASTVYVVSSDAGERQVDAPQGVALIPLDGQPSEVRILPGGGTQ